MKKQNKSNKQIKSQKARTEPELFPYGWAMPPGCLKPIYTEEDLQELVEARRKARATQAQKVDPCNHFVGLSDAQ